MSMRRKKGMRSSISLIHCTHKIVRGRPPYLQACSGSSCGIPPSSSSSSDTRSSIVNDAKAFVVEATLALSTEGSTTNTHSCSYQKETLMRYPLPPSPSSLSPTPYPPSSLLLQEKHCVTAVGTPKINCKSVELNTVSGPVHPQPMPGPIHWGSEWQVEKVVAFENH